MAANVESDCNERSEQHSNVSEAPELKALYSGLERLSSAAVEKPLGQAGTKQLVDKGFLPGMEICLVKGSSGARLELQAASRALRVASLCPDGSLPVAENS